MKKKFMKKSIIVAMSANHGIGKDNKLMWNIPDDLKRFKNITNGHHVIMGRKTYESIIEKLGKPLPNRTSIVLTNNKEYKTQDGILIASSVKEALSIAESHNETEVFIIGGGQIYAETIEMVDSIYLTRLLDVINGADTFFPAIDYSKFNIRASNEDFAPSVERKIYRNFTEETHNHEFMILDRIS